MNMEIEQEKALVERAKTDPDAFGELYDANYTAIFNYLLRRTANIIDAQDLTSEVFMKAFKKIGKFKWSGSRSLPGCTVSRRMKSLINTEKANMSSHIIWT